MAETVLDAATRRALRAAITDRWPFVADLELGPQSVVAGECDRCGVEPRMVQPCHTASPDGALGARCALEVGLAVWCEGHHDDAERAFEWLADLPDDADTVARLWWVATGEVRPDPVLRSAAAELVAATYPRRP